MEADEPFCASWTPAAGLAAALLATSLGRGVAAALGATDLAASLTGLAASLAAAFDGSEVELLADCEAGVVLFAWLAAFVAASRGAAVDETGETDLFGCSTAFVTVLPDSRTAGCA